MIEHMFEEFEDLCTKLAEGLRVAGMTAGVLSPSQDVKTLTQAAETTERLRRLADVAQLCVLTELARRGLERGDDGLLREVRAGPGVVAEMATDGIAMALGCSDYIARTRSELAVRLTDDLDPLVGSLLRGDVPVQMVQVVADETVGVSREAVEAVVAHVLAPKRGTDTPRIEVLDKHDLAQACRRVIDREEPAFRERQATTNRREHTDVRTYPGKLGTTELVATLPSEIAMTLMSAVDEVATQRRRDDSTLLTGPARALALTDLALRGVAVSAHVTLGLSVVRCPGEGGLPDEGGVVPMGSTRALWLGGVEVPKIGWIPGSVVEQLTERLDTRVTRALLDPEEGTVLETSVTGYVPPPSVKRLVRLRDGRCRMWGCERPAAASDLDHATPWPEGETTGTNLSALCRHHHRVKHSPGWSHALHPDGTTEWVSSGGSRRVTWPTEHAPAAEKHEASRELAAEPTGADSTPELTTPPNRAPAPMLAAASESPPF